MTEEIKLASLDKKEALRYLGYGDNDEPDRKILAILEQCEEQVLKSAKPKTVYRCFNFKRTPKGIEVEGTGLVLTGNSIEEHLSGCGKLVLLCATISSEIDRLIRRLEVEDKTLMLVTDSLSSVAVEQVCDKAELMIAKEFPEYYQTWRFGVGYGDLPLVLQKDFLNALDAGKRVGVYATSSSLLTPRKSVTCIIGLSREPIAKKRRGCQTCTMRDRCLYRKSGISCSS